MTTFIDLFSGCGGMSLGFTRAGFDILGGIEIDATAIKTHGMNFFRGIKNPSIGRHERPVDITNYPPERYAQEMHINNPQEDVDLIIGGPPCQAFARVGRAKLREIMRHPNAFLQDMRASLYIHFLEYVEYFNPLAVVMENVPDIMNFGGMNVAEEIASSLDDFGYKCRYTILNTARYGVPQMRQRFFLMAIREDLGVTPVFPECTHEIQLPPGYQNAHKVALNWKKEESLFNNTGKYYVEPPEPDQNLPAAITARNALEDLPFINVAAVTRGARKFDTLARYRDDVEPSEYALMMRQWPEYESDQGVYDHVTRYLPRDYRIFRAMRPGDQYPEAFEIAMSMFRENKRRVEAEKRCQIEVDSLEYKEMLSEFVPPYDPGKFPNKWRKMESDEPSRTLMAHIGKDTYSHIHYDSQQSRVISVREAARLQSFPDGFKFAGAMNAAFRQIGNAVPPLQAFAIAMQVQGLIEPFVITRNALADEELIDYERAVK